MIEAGSYRHGVQRQGQAQVTDGQVDDEELGGLQEAPLLVRDVQQRAVANQRTDSCRANEAQSNHNEPEAFKVF